MFIVLTFVISVIGGIMIGRATDIGRTVSRPRDRRSFRRFRERVVAVFRRLIPFKGNCAWEVQVGAWVFQIKHPESTVTLANERGTLVVKGSRYTLWVWKDPHWWGEIVIPCGG